MVSFSALLALGAIGVGMAQAASPIQPQYTSSRNGVIGETIKSNVTIEDVSARTRLWSTELSLVIRCEKDSSEGFLEPNGRDSGTVSYTECKVFGVKENAVAQIEEGEELKCTVAEPIKTASLSSRLVWAKGSPVLLVLYQPKAGIGTAFVTIKLTGASCLPKGEYEVKGALLGLAPRFNEEWIEGPVLFNTVNANKKVVQQAKEFEVKKSYRLERHWKKKQE